MVKNNFLTNISKKKLCCVLFAVGLSIVCMISVGITLAQHSKTQTTDKEITIVRTAVVGNAGMAQEYTYSGEVRGRFESQLAFQVNGKIIKRNVQLGSPVSTGDILMQIDSRDLKQTVNSNSAQVSSAESQLKLAESDLNRYRQLLESGAISRAQYEKYANSYEVALAGLGQSSAQYQQGSNQLDYSFLCADKPGVVSSLAAEVGQVVTAGQVVMTVVQDGDREIEISVPENRVEELQKSGQIKVTFWALPQLVLNGSIREIAPMTDQTTRTFKVRIALINPPPEIKLGMTASVSIFANAQQTIIIPMAAVYQDGNIPKVWLVKEDVLVLQPIQTGNIGNGTIQVSGGLQPGERIVIAGVHKLKEGQKVKFDGDLL